MIGFIFIYRKKLFDIKIKIYYQIIRVIIKNKSNNRYLSNKFLSLYFTN